MRSTETEFFGCRRGVGLVLTGGDWLPGGIIVAAALVGLSVLVPEIWRLCSRGPAPSPPSTNRAGPHRHHRPPEPHA